MSHHSPLDSALLKAHPIRIVYAAAIVAGLGPVARLLIAIAGNVPAWLPWVLDALTLGACGMALFAADRIARATLAVDEALADIARPAADAPAQSSGDPVQNLLQRVSGVRASFAETRAEIQRVRRSDPVTGLGNRAWLRVRAGEEMERAAREKAPLSLILAQVEHFRPLVEHHGVEAGEAALISMADLLRDFLRPYDLVGRISEDTFCVLLPGAGGVEADRIMQRLREAVSRRELVMLGERQMATRFALAERRTSEFFFDRLLARAQASLSQPAGPAP
jgi:diguanylate cyclase (GGDEF)-like protein